jgi:hypothetical protein
MIGDRDFEFVTLDDDECYQASRLNDRRRWSTCPDCLECEAETTLLDAASHREDGNELIARELEAEAAQLRSRAVKIRDRQSGSLERPGA